jgi:CHAD domain-containing protein
LADKGGAAQISTAMRVRAEIIASDVSLLVTFNHAIDGMIHNNPTARANPKALAQLDGYPAVERIHAFRLAGKKLRYRVETTGR